MSLVRRRPGIVDGLIGAAVDPLGARQVMLKPI
jgi:hypothetical protein